MHDLSRPRILAVQTITKLGELAARGKGIHEKILDLATACEVND